LLCEPFRGLADGFDVWADARGVYALAATSCNVLGGGSCGKHGISLQHNDGSGWKPLYTQAAPEVMGSTGATITGFESGPLLFSGFMKDQYGLWQVEENGEASLQTALFLGKPFVVGEGRAYALGETALYRFAEGEWSESLPLPGTVLALWANEDLVIVVGLSGAVYTSQGGAPFEQLGGAPERDYSAVWAFGADDIWLGTSAGQLVPKQAIGERRA
jgi:hypothetical protein